MRTFISNAKGTCIVRVSLAHGTVRGRPTGGHDVGAGPIGIIGTLPDLSADRAPSVPQAP